MSAKGQGVPQTLKITQSKDAALVRVWPEIHSYVGNTIPQSHTDGIWRWGLRVTGPGGLCPNEHSGLLTDSWIHGLLREWPCHKGTFFLRWLLCLFGSPGQNAAMKALPRRQADAGPMHGFASLWNSELNKLLYKLSSLCYSLIATENLNLFKITTSIQNNVPNLFNNNWILHFQSWLEIHFISLSIVARVYNPSI